MLGTTELPDNCPVRRRHTLAFEKSRLEGVVWAVAGSARAACPGRSIAAGVILINNTGDDLFSPSGLSNTDIPAALVGSSAGTAMKIPKNRSPRIWG